MKLRDYLAVTQITAKVFAAAVGVTTTTVWRWLDGTRHPSRTQMRRIHEATKGAVSPNDLVLE